MTYCITPNSGSRCCYVTSEEREDKNSDSDDENDITSFRLNRSSRPPVSEDLLREFPPEQHRRFALACILAVEFFRKMAIQTATVWIPIAVSLSSLFFPDAKTNVGSHQHFKYKWAMVTVISNVLIYSPCWLVGIVSDACIKKTRILTVTAILMYAGFIFFCIILYDVSNHIDCGSYNPDISLVNCSITADPLVGYTDHVIIYTILWLAALESVFVTVLPVYGGDQIPDVDTVRQFYALYYWFRKLGEVISGLFCIILMFVAQPVYFDRGDYQNFFRLFNVGWSSFALTAATLATIFMFIVACCRITREPRADLSVITHTVGIWKQACLRRKYRRKDESCLDMAKSSNYGSYADMAVVERRDMALFFCVVLCLVPVGFATKLPSDGVPTTKVINEDQSIITKAYFVNEWKQASIMIYCKLGNYVSSALLIPLVHYLCTLLRQRYGVYVSFLHRITAGQLLLIISVYLYMLTTHLYSNEVSLRVLLAPSIFLGMSYALVYTVVYEMNMILAPRSMQSTSMGMFRFYDGAGSLIHLAAVHSSSEQDIDYSLGFGILAIIIGMSLIILLSKKVGISSTHI